MSPDDTARFLAGMQPHSSVYLAGLASREEWLRFASEMDSGWAQFEQRRLAKVRAFSQSDLPPMPGTLFYPFSGPDFAYAFTYFPQALTFVLCGLEPAGDVPALDQLPPGTLDPSLQGLLTSLNTVFTAGYFVTKDMRVQLRNHRFGGTLPILLVFLARSGCTVLDVKKLPEGAQIDFLADGSRRSLFYFTVDLSDAGLKSNSTCPAFRGGANDLARKAMDTATLMGPQRSDVQMDVTVYWMRQGDFPRALQHWNTVLRHQPGLRSKFFPYLLKGAEDTAGQSAFEALLRQPLPWWTDFFSYAAAHEANSDTVRRLFSLSRKGANAFPPEALRAYLARLQKDGDWTEAWFAWLSSLTKEELAHSAYVYNGSFEMRPSSIGASLTRSAAPYSRSNIARKV